MLDDLTRKRLAELKARLSQKQGPSLVEDNVKVRAQIDLERKLISAPRPQDVHRGQALRIAAKLTTSSSIFSTITEGENSIDYHENTWLPVSFGASDHKLFQLANELRGDTSRIAIGLPRVPRGISTWLAASGIVSTASETFRRPARGAPGVTAGNERRAIVIATRSRQTRDIYLSQRIRVGKACFPVSDFPAYRFKRDGQLARISSVESGTGPLSTPIVFYHFDSIESSRVDLRARLVLAEMTEADAHASRLLLGRLQDLVVIAGAPQILVFFNSFSRYPRAQLREMNFVVLDLRPEVNNGSTRFANFPSAATAFAGFPTRQEVEVLVVDDERTSECLHEGARALYQTGKAVTTPEGARMLDRWWTIWRLLKNLGIDTEIYDAYRIKAQQRGTLENAIRALGQVAERVEGNDGMALRGVAPAITHRLVTLLQAVSGANRKAAQVQELMLDALEGSSGARQRVAFSERTQRDALRDHLLFDDPELLEEGPTLSYLVDAASIAASLPLEHLILCGVWAPWEQASVVSAGARKLTVVIYPYERRLLEARLAEHSDDCTRQLSCFGQTAEQYQPLLVLTDTTRDTLRELREMGEEASIDQSQHTIKTTVTDLEDRVMEFEDDVPTADITRLGITLIFDDGTRLTTAAGAETLLVTDDHVEAVFAETLQPTDQIAVMKGAVTRSIFDAVLSRVSHLVQVDQRVVEMWRSAVRRLLVERAHDGGVATLIRSLRRAGCMKTDEAIRTWFRGSTMAPGDSDDIQRVLEIAGVARAEALSAVIQREVDQIRVFNRTLGRRVREHIRSLVTGRETRRQNRLEFEIDEALEAVEYKTILRIEKSR